MGIENKNIELNKVKEVVSGKSEASDVKFEEFKNKVKEIYNLFYLRKLADFAVRQEYEPGRGWVKKLESTVILKDFPEFRDLYEEEHSMLSGSVSPEEIREYSDLYRRLKEKVAEIEAKLKSFDNRQHRDEFNTAAAIFNPYRLKKWEEVNESELKELFNKYELEEEEGKKYSEAHGRYLKIIYPMMRAKAGIQARIDAETSLSQAKEGGYSSPEEMLEDYVSKIRTLRQELGEQMFRRVADRYFSDEKERKMLREIGVLE